MPRSESLSSAAKLARLLPAVLAISFAGCASSERNDTSESPTAGEVIVAERKRLSENGSTRATAYAMSNKIISANGKTFVAWLDYVADALIATYDSANGTWAPPVLLGVGEDNHGGPAITMDADGFLHAVFGPHHGPFQYRRSLRPYDASEWTEVDSVGSRATYPSLVVDRDQTLHLTYRGGPDHGEGGWYLMYKRKPAGGAWSDAVVIARPSGEYSYTQYGNPLAASADGVLHLGFHFYVGSALGTQGEAVGYLRSRDGGTSWENARGEPVGLPIDQQSPVFIEQGPALDMRIGNLVVDADNRPWLTALHLEKRPQSVTVWRLEASGWQAIDLRPVIADRYPDRGLVQATLTFDRSGRLYVAASTIGPQAETWFGDPSQEIILLTSDDRGATFDVIAVSEIDPDLPNWLPSIERPYGPAPIGVPGFLYTHGEYGEFGKNKEGTPGGVWFVQLATEPEP